MKQRQDCASQPEPKDERERREHSEKIPYRNQAQDDSHDSPILRNSARKGNPPLVERESSGLCENHVLTKFPAWARASCSTMRWGPVAGQFTATPFSGCI